MTNNIIFDKKLASLRKKRAVSDPDFYDVSYIYNFGADIISDFLEEYHNQNDNSNINENQKKQENTQNNIQNFKPNIFIIGDRSFLLRKKLEDQLSKLNLKNITIIISFFDINLRNNLPEYLIFLKNASLKNLVNLSDFRNSDFNNFYDMEIDDFSKINLSDFEERDKSENRIFIGCFVGGENSLVNLRNKFFELEAKNKLNHYLRIAPMIRIKDFTGLLQKIGFKDVICGSENLNVEYSSILKILEDIYRMGESNSLYRKEYYPLSKLIYNDLKNQTGKFEENFEIVSFFVK